MLLSQWRKLVRSCVRAATVRPARNFFRFEALEDRLTPAGVIAIIPPAGTAASVSVLDAATGQQKFLLDPYPGFTGGISAAVGDVNGDGTTDVITAPGAGGGA